MTHGKDMDAGARPEIAALFEETVALYLRLSRTAVTIHGLGQLSGPRRTVLVAIARSGPQTVSQLARTRAQSRQRFQPLVNALVKEGLLELRDNPAHRQSPLVALTARGTRAVRRIVTLESRYRAGMKISSSPAQIAAATRVLREIREWIEGVRLPRATPRKPRRRR